MSIYGRNIAARPEAIRTYLFNGEWHTVPSDEFNAIERSGRSNWEAYRFEDPPEPPVHGAIHHMKERPGQNKPGSSPMDMNYSTLLANQRRLALSLHSRNYTDWTTLEDMMLLSLRAHSKGGGYAWWHISDKMGRSEGSCKLRHRNLLKRASK